MKRSHRAYDVIKRALDLVTAAALAFLLSPVLLAVAIAVRVKLGTPVLFRQSRPGKNGEIFTILKFRSMRTAEAGTSDIDAVGSDAARLTRFGRFLRSTSLDELPELWNVIKGDMSMVGPRPLLVDYLTRYNEQQARRHEVRPGLTGWAQVNGRNTTSWQERLAMDTWYVDHRSLGLDARIVLLTLKTVLGRQGVSAEGEATMTQFEGNARDEESR